MGDDPEFLGVEAGLTSQARSVSPPPRGVVMALSDQLSKLATRAKEAEDHAAAAKGKAKTELEQDVRTAQESAQAQADRLRQNAEADKESLSKWWNETQSNWNKHVAKVHKHVE